MSKMDKLKEIIRELIRKELSEASVTGDIAGYQTPYAFTGKSAKGKKKKKKISTNSTGYNVVKEGKYHDYRNDDTMTPKQKETQKNMEKAFTDLINNSGFQEVKVKDIDFEKLYNSRFN